MSNSLKLPITFDDEVDLVDAGGALVLFGSDMIQHNPDIAAEIARRVNNHDRLAEMLREVTATMAWLAHGECRVVDSGPILSSDQAQEKAITLLAQIDAGEGGVSDG